MIKMPEKTLSEKFELSRAEETWKKFFDAANIFVVEKKISVECGTNIFGEKEIVTPEFYVPNCTGRCENIFLTFDEHTADVLFRLNMPAMILPCTLSLFEDADNAKEASAIFNDICVIGDSDKTFNCIYIDGDWFGCAPLVLTSPEGKGVLSLCGSDSSYYECDEKATEHAYTEAGKVFRNYR